ncbi:MAG: hypothetical protein ACJAWL_001621 [Motiliproteus sp.]|jgi:hypothetical protein
MAGLSLIQKKVVSFAQKGLCLYGAITPVRPGKSETGSLGESLKALLAAWLEWYGVFRLDEYDWQYHRRGIWSVFIDQV